MDANIITMIVIKKNKNSNSSYLFEDTILGWAGNENSKKDLNQNMIYGHCKVHLLGLIKRLIKTKIIKKNSKIMIDKFFQLSKIKKTKVNNIYNHGWKYSSNSKN